MFSKMGKQKGTNDLRFKCHDDFYDNIQRVSDVMLVENVPEYAVTIPKERLKNWGVQYEVIDPRVLGIPSSRARVFILAFNRARVSWTSDV